jgi:hypothetical protein
MARRLTACRPPSKAVASDQDAVVAPENPRPGLLAGIAADAASWCHIDTYVEIMDGYHPSETRGLGRDYNLDGDHPGGVEPLTDIATTAVAAKRGAIRGTTRHQIVVPFNGSRQALNESTPRGCEGERNIVLRSARRAADRGSMDMKTNAPTDVSDCAQTRESMSTMARLRPAMRPANAMLQLLNGRSRPRSSACSSIGATISWLASRKVWPPGCSTQRGAGPCRAVAGPSSS